MAEPTLLAYLALSSRPTEAPQWVDESGRVRLAKGVHLTRGRQRDLDRFEVGTATLALDNRDRRFDPSHATGPYYGDLKPMRRLRLSAVYEGVDYPLFSGYVDGFAAEWPGSGADAVTPIRAADGLRVLGLADILAGTAFAEQLSSARIDAVLDLTGWTTGGTWLLDSATNSQLDSTTILSPITGDRVILAGNTTVQAETFADKANALEYCQQVERAEGGRLFVNAEGAICFYNRHYLLGPDQQTSRYTFADASDPAALPYYDLVTSYDDGDLYNVVSCERRGGTARTAEDATSKLEYFRRATAETDLLATTDAEMADRAAWLLSRRKDPGYRVKALVIRPQRDDRLWVPCLSLEIGDRITVQRLPQGLGDAWAEDYRIERIEWTIQGGLWQVVWQLSPADSVLYWHVSDGSDEFAPFAVLGVSTVLAY
ncbi:MAG TPA: hypothetical protein VFH17_04820 [Coriobacteriia bacterium]|nr:hypothetical protein [Coriobacteriia bacterium]